MVTLVDDANSHLLALSATADMSQLHELAGVCTKFAAGLRQLTDAIYPEVHFSTGSQANTRVSAMKLEVQSI
jgi:hypothetical protein